MNVPKMFILKSIGIIYNIIQFQIGITDRT